MHYPRSEAGHNDQIFRSGRRQGIQIVELQALIGYRPGNSRTVLDKVFRPEGVRLKERLQRTGEIEHLASVEIGEDYATAPQRVPFNSLMSCVTVAMRAKRRRRAYSVRSRIASTPSSSPGLSQLGIGNVIVASVTKSTAYPRSAATLAVVS